MELWKAMLIALLGYFGVNRTPWLLGQAGGFFGIAQPLVSCAIIGAIHGDVQTGVMVGAAIQAMYLGVIQPGGALPSDKAAACFIGASLAIASGGGVEAAIALAVPLGLLGSAIFQLFMTFNAFFPHLGDAAAERGDGEGVARANILGTVPTCIFYFILYTVANYAGVGLVEALLGALPQSVITTLSIMAKIVPAVGFAMLLKYVITEGRGWMVSLFVLGFLIVLNTSFNIVSLTLLSIAVAVLYVMARYGEELFGNKQAVATTTAAPVEDEDGEYDE